VKVHSEKHHRKATTNCFPMVEISGSSERHIVDVQRGDYEELDQLAAAKPFVRPPTESIEPKTSAAASLAGNHFASPSR
jgi:hypothetical protein